MTKDDAVLQFLIQEEGFKARTYIPKKDGKAIGKSGLTFGIGIDIGQMSVKEFLRLGLPKSFEEAMLPYVGKKGEEATAVERELGHFTLPTDVAMDISRRYVGKSKQKLSKAFPKFDSLPVQQQAVALSLLHNYGTAALRYKTMKAVINGDLETAITKLRNPDEWKNVELHPRRNREADLLQSLIQPQQQQRGLMQ
jgi:hypothetical protein